MEKNTQRIQSNKYETPSFSVLLPNNAVTSQNHGCTRTGMPRIEKFKSYGVRSGSMRMITGKHLAREGFVKLLGILSMGLRGANRISGDGGVRYAEEWQ